MKNIRTEEIFEENFDDEQEWEVEKIIKERTKLKKNKKTGKMQECKEYLIKWVGYKTPTWEPEENLEHSQEILKEFLLKEIMKKLKQEKNKSILQTSGVYRYEKSPSLTEYKIVQTKRKLSESAKEEEPSTISNSIINNNTNTTKNKNNKKNKLNKKSLSMQREIKEENEADVISYDIEIVDDNKDKDKDNNKNNEKAIKKQNDETDEESLKGKNENENIKKKEKEKKRDKKISHKSKIFNDNVDEEETPVTSIDHISHSNSIYLDEEEKVVLSDKEEKKSKNEEKKTSVFLEKKRLKSEKDKSGCLSWSRAF